MSLIETLAERERFRDNYIERRDPIAGDRLLWRAQTLRHLAHLLPGQRVLELGCGRGYFTRALLQVSREENPVTAVTFDPAASPKLQLAGAARRVHADELPGPLTGERFDVVVALDLLDRRNCAWLLQHVHEFLEPGGQVVFFETNPWNPALRLRRKLSGILTGSDPRALLSRPQLYEMMSEVGFVRVFAVANDFVYAPLTPGLAWPLRNLSILLENAPGVRALAGSLLVHAQKPPHRIERVHSSLFVHEELRSAVSVVVPCHNEEMNIGPLVTRMRQLFGPYLHEIIPVDDNSTDATAEVLRELAATDPLVRPIFRSPPNGVGRALADGYRAARGEWILSMDSDFQHLLPEVRDLFDAATEGYDVVVGSRFSRYSVLLNYPFLKIFANRGFHLLAQLLLWRSFRDLTNNLKMMRRDIVDQLELIEPGFAVNAETGLQPLVMGYRIREVPISWINRTPDMGSSSFRLARVGGGYGRVLGRLLLRDLFRRGPYRALPTRGPERQTRSGPAVGPPAPIPSR